VLKPSAAVGTPDCCSRRQDSIIRKCKLIMARKLIIHHGQRNMLYNHSNFMTNSWWLIQNYPWHSRASEDMLCSMCVMDVPRAVRSSTTPRSSIYDDSQTFKANPGFMSRSEIKQCDQSCQMVCDTQKKQSSFTSTEFNVENLFKIRAKRKKTFATNPLPSQPSDTAMK